MNLADREAYKDMDDRDDNSNDNTYGGPGDIDGRATMVPPSGFSTLHVSIKIKVQHCKPATLNYIQIS